MESRNSNKWNSNVKEESDDIEKIQQVELEPPASVWLKSNFPDNLVVIGSVSGKHYVFPRGGSEAEVDARDVEGLLKKTFGGYGCCGNGHPTPLFIIVSK